MKKSKRKEKTIKVEMKAAISQQLVTKNTQVEMITAFVKAISQKALIQNLLPQFSSSVD